MEKVVKKIIVMIILFISLLLLGGINSNASSGDYYITVNYGSNVVTVYTKDANRKLYYSI